jgi:Ni/Fe-hydrogenase subunit HybB-like protein
MATDRASARIEEVIDTRYDWGSVTDHVVGIPLRPRFPHWWLAAAGAALAVTLMGLVSAMWLLYWGPGVWGINIPVAWGFAILNFVWWIGIGHAGTLISAILLLFRQSWRTSINRFAEAMTLFAVMNAGLFPLMHLGRFWKFYYLLPYPDTMRLWPQWRSPLVWDVIAVLTYATVSFIFWYVGLIPDLATLRDSARRKWTRRIAGIFALGWRGAARHWQNHQMAYLLLAGLATPLVVSVHSIVSLDFATAIVPGWHTTIFPPYFVAGAIYSGFAMVLTLILPARALFNLRGLITIRHLNVMSKVMLTSGLVVAYGYVLDNFTAFFSAGGFERYMARDRALGGYAPIYWATLTCNVLIPQFLWFRWVRTHVIPLFLVSTAINVGMWTERFTIVIQPLHRDFMPSAWGWFTATAWDWTLFVGTLGLFCLAMLLFARIVPMLSMSELRELLHRKKHAVAEVDKPLPPPERPEKTSAPPDLADTELHGMCGMFDGPESLVEAARRARDAGYRHLDAFSPFPIEDLPAALNLGRSHVSLLVLVGALLGAGGIFGLQTYAAVFDYPWNIGGRPLFSWPSFIPLTFEVGVLGGALFGLVGMLLLNRLPKPYDPIFNTAGFERASRDRFFLLVSCEDPKFDRSELPQHFAAWGAIEVQLVPAYTPEGRS